MEPAVRVDERGDPAAIRHRRATDEVEMEPDLEAGLVAGQVGGLLAAGERHEERRGPDDAVAVGLEDPLGDAGRQAEVVGADDDRVHE